jgi:hypothetical protein
MMSEKFASLTSALLVRKGEARPSLVGVAATRSVPTHAAKPVAHPAERIPERTPDLAAADRKRRVVVTLSCEEYQRLGIIAAKRNSTRQELVRGALFEQLDAFAKDQGKECPCVGSGQACGCPSPSDHSVSEIPAFAVV